jgi:hypothetical protein
MSKFEIYLLFDLAVLLIIGLVFLFGRAILKALT